MLSSIPSSAFAPQTAPPPAAPPASAPDLASRVVFGPALDIHENWAVPIEADPSRNPSQEQPAYSLLPAPDGTLAVNGTRGTYGFRPDGTTAWSLATGYCPNTPALGPDGTVYTSSQRDLAHPEEVPRLSAAHDDGQGMHVVWSREDPQAVARFAPTVGPDGRVYALADHRLTTLASDGGDAREKDWSELEGSRPRPLADGRMIMMQVGGYALYNPRTDQVERVYSYREEWPVRVLDDGTTFWWNGTTLRCVAPDFQTERWRYDYKDDRDRNFPQITVARDGSVLAMRNGTLSGTQVTVLAPDGKPRWEWKPDGGPAWMGETPYLSDNLLLDDDGVAYLSGDKRIYAVNPDGTLKWSQHYLQTCNNIQLGPNGTIVASDPSTSLRLISCKDGETLWTSPFQLGHGYPSTRVVGDDVYTATHDCQLVSIHCGKRGAEPPPTPGETPTIDREPEYVVINGVRVPVRR